MRNDLGEEWGEILARHRSAMLRQSDIDDAHIIVPMTNSIVNSLRVRYSGVEERLCFLEEVNDPIYVSTIESYHNCAMQLSNIIEQIIDKINH